jgi:TPR repeat protein
MATDMGNADFTVDDAVHAEAETEAPQAPRSMREELKNPSRKRSVRADAYAHGSNDADPHSPSSDAMTRLEQRLAILEKSVANIADVVERHEVSLREREDAMASVGQSVIALCKRIDDSEKQRDEEAAELRAALAEASRRLNALEADRANHAHAAVAPAYMDQAPKWGSEAMPPMAGDVHSASETPANDETPTQIQNYLSVARSAANAESGSKDKKFATQRRGNRAQYVIFGCAAPLMVVAAATIALNRNPVTAEPVPVPAAFVPVEKPQVAQLPAPAPVLALPPPPHVIIAPPAEPTAEQLASSESLDALQAKATAGDPAAERALGLTYLAGNSVEVSEEEAARWLLRASYRGEPTAEYWLGTLYAAGHGVPADMIQANHWYSASAKLGNRNAMHRLAVANFAGLGMENNPEQAARWFAQAAQLGLSDSQFDLAVMYERGTGVAQNLVDAYKWYSAAAAQGDKEAADRVTVLAKELKPAELDLAMQAAAAFKADLTDENGIAANLTAP